MSDFLGKHGYDVETAADALEAIVVDGPRVLCVELRDALARFVAAK